MTPPAILFLAASCLGGGFLAGWFCAWACVRSVERRLR